MSDLDPKQRDDPFAQVLATIDEGTFTPTPRRHPRPEAAAVGQVAEALNFPSRDPARSPDPRRGRPPTGRHIPVSYKVSEETKAMMDDVYEHLNIDNPVRIPMGEILRRAFIAYRRDLGLDPPAGD